MSKRTCKIVAEELRARATYRGWTLPADIALTLARAERTLHRWAELECGDGNDHASWAIERDAATGKPFRGFYPRNGKPTRYPIADRERGALNRVARVLEWLRHHSPAGEAAPVYFYHQTDPRGCALYVSSEPLTDQNYPNGIAVR